ncbi:MAG: hypothetical protein QXO17_05925 [Nitrososphaerota archaeon]
MRADRIAPRDRDMFATEEGWIFTVLGDVHPPKRIWSYLKYVPGPGPWRAADGRTYTRVFTTYTVRELLSIMDEIRARRPEYLYYDPVVGNEVIAPPVDAVIEYWSTSIGLRRMSDRVEEGRASRLEQEAIGFVRWLESHAGLKRNDFGVTGSLLLGIHHDRSDIDLVVYGRRNLMRALEALRTAGEPVKPGAGQRLVETLRAIYRMPATDARSLAARVVHKGLFGSTHYSVFGVRDQPMHGYGDYQYVGKGIVEVEVEITDSSESLFTPSIYRVEEKVLGIERIMSYHMVLAGLFEPGDRLRVRAKLEEVKGPRGEALQLVLGSYEAVGSEQIKLLG